MITDSFDNKTEPLVNLKYFYGEKNKIIDTCLIIFSKTIHDTLLIKYECKKIAEIGACNGTTPVYRFTYRKKEIAFYLSPVGSTGASQYCIECNWLTGAEKFIMFGSAGSLDRNKTTGRFVVPTEAYRDEGMSYHYLPASDYIKIKNHGKIKVIFDSLHIPYIEGRIWTTDAFLRETVGQIQLRKSEGCIAVEMEVAGVQSVCDFYGFELYDFLETGDILSTDNYQMEGLSDANHNLDKLYIALEIAEQV